MRCVGTHRGVDKSGADSHDDPEREEIGEGVAHPYDLEEAGTEGGKEGGERRGGESVWIRGWRECVFAPVIVLTVTTQSLE